MCLIGWVVDWKPRPSIEQGGLLDDIVPLVACFPSIILLLDAAAFQAVLLAIDQHLAVRNKSHTAIHTGTSWLTARNNSASALSEKFHSEILLYSPGVCNINSQGSSGEEVVRM